MSNKLTLRESREIKEIPQTRDYISRYENHPIQPTKKSFKIGIPQILIIGIGLLVLFSRNSIDLGFLAGLGVSIAIPMLVWEYMYGYAKIRFTESVLIAILVEGLLFANHGVDYIMANAMRISISIGNISMTVLMIIAALIFVYLFQRGKK